MKMSIRVLTLISTAFIYLAPITTPTVVIAADEMILDVSDANAIKLSLDKLIGKTVSFRLENGEDITGVLEGVGSTTARLGKLTGKEFYSALIAIDKIIAITYRAK